MSAEHKESDQASILNNHDADEVIALALATSIQEVIGDYENEVIGGQSQEMTPPQNLRVIQV